MGASAGSAEHRLVRPAQPGLAILQHAIASRGSDLAALLDRHRGTRSSGGSHGRQPVALITSACLAGIRSRACR